VEMTNGYQADKRMDDGVSVYPLHIRWSLFAIPPFAQHPCGAPSCSRMW